MAGGSHADEGGSYTGVQTGMGAHGASVSTETPPWQRQPQRGQQSPRTESHHPGPPHLGPGLAWSVSTLREHHVSPSPGILALTDHRVANGLSVSLDGPRPWPLLSVPQFPPL